MILSNPFALLGLLALLPLIVLYLIKPKPVEAEIPSLIFIQRMMEKESRYDFLRKLIRDPLLLIQALVLVFLTFAMVNPYYVGSMEVESENVVLVLDASASMQARDVSPSRFEKAVELARAAIRDEDRVSVILAESFPLPVLREGSGREAKVLLGALKPKATETNLGEAILLAVELLRDKNHTRIIVASDFSYSTTDYEVARRIAAAEGIIVNYLRVGGTGSNVGIVGLTPVEDGIVLKLRNYGDGEVNTVLEVYREEELLYSSDIELPPGGSKLFSISALPPGDLELTLRHEDDLPLDNNAYLVIPRAEALRVLLITENQSFYLSRVLNSSGRVKLREVRPPILPSFHGYDLIVMDGVGHDSLLPGTIKALRDYVSKGGTLVVIASHNLPLIDELEELLPVTFKDGYGEGKVERATVNQLTLELELEGVNTKYLLAARKPASVDLIVAEDERKTPVVSHRMLGEGNVFYYGLKPDPDWGNFHLTLYYPIFWFNLLEYVKKEGKTKVYRTGEFLAFPEGGKVKSPSAEAEFRGGKVFLDEAGFYRLGEEKVGVSLLSEAESNITSPPIYQELGGDTGRITLEITREFKVPLLILALALVGAELVALKYRGEF